MDLPIVFKHGGGVFAAVEEVGAQEQGVAITNMGVRPVIILELYTYTT